MALCNFYRKCYIMQKCSNFVAAYKFDHNWMKKAEVLVTNKQTLGSSD